jgi:hypothetical protein
VVGAPNFCKACGNRLTPPRAEPLPPPADEAPTRALPAPIPAPPAPVPPVLPAPTPRAEPPRRPPPAASPPPPPPPGASGGNRRTALFVTGAVVATLLVVGGALAAAGLFSGDDEKKAPTRRAETPAPSPAPAGEEPAAAPTTAEVKDLLATYTERYGAEDADGLGELFTADLVRSSKGEASEDKEEALATYREQFSSLSGPVYTLSGLRLSTGPGEATARGRYRISSSAGTTDGAIAFHLVREADRLLIDRIDIVPAGKSGGSSLPRVSEFKTPTDPGESRPAAYCTLRGDSLYCWTPNDGYTLELREGAGFDRVGDDDANRDREPGGFETLDFGSEAEIGAFKCTSSSSDLTCVDSGGHGFSLPRYHGLPRAIG